MCRLALNASPLWLLANGQPKDCPYALSHRQRLPIDVYEQLYYNQVRSDGILTIQTARYFSRDKAYDRRKSFRALSSLDDDWEQRLTAEDPFDFFVPMKIPVSAANAAAAEGSAAAALSAFLHAATARKWRNAANHQFRKCSNRNKFEGSSPSQYRRNYRNKIA